MSKAERGSDHSEVSLQGPSVLRSEEQDYMCGKTLSKFSLKS